MRPFRELARLFFGRFFENDLICVDSDTRGTLTGILALLAAPGLFIPFLEFVQFSGPRRQPVWVMDLASIPDKGIYIAFSMTVLGVVTVLQWDTLLPDRRDYAILRPLPVSLATIFSAKVVALFGFWAIFTLAVNLCSMVFFPLAVVQWGTLGQLVWFARCHIVAILAANAFVFLSMIAAQGVLLIVLGARLFRRLAPFVQLLLIAGHLVMFFAAAGLAPSLLPGRAAPELALALPPLWFLGLYQAGLGWPQPVFQQLAERAGLALAGAAIVAAVAYALSYRRVASDSFDSPECALRRPAWIVRAATSLAHWVWLRSPAERAAFHFVWQTATRSRSHRLLVAASVAVGVALVFQGVLGAIAGGSRAWWQSPRGVLLPVPLVLSLFLLSGLRYAFTVPAELRANWLFQVAATGDPAACMAGARKAAAMLGIVPLFVVLLPVHIALWGWTQGAVHVLFGATVAWLLLDSLMLGFDKLPFTCSYVPGKANLKASWPLYILAYLAYVTFLSALELLILSAPSRLIWFLLFAAGLKFGLERYRRRLLADDFRLIFDEQPEPAVRTLDLAQ